MNVETATPSNPSNPPGRVSDAFDLPMPKAGTGMIHKLDQTGDSKLIWDYKNDVEVKAAKKMFDTLKKEGYIAYSVGKDNEPGEVMKSFDPKAEKIIMSPPVVGG